MAGIFISYRRSDAAGWAGRLSDSLRNQLGRGVVFRDIDSIPPGVEFESYIAQAVGSCDVLLALIGPQWLTARRQDDQRRLDEPGDLIRLEIATALSRQIRVIPVLLGGVEPPSVEELPEELKPLARRQAYEVTDARWAEDCSRLSLVLRPLVKGGRSRRAMLALGIVTAVVLLGPGLVILQWRHQSAEREKVAPQVPTAQTQVRERAAPAPSKPSQVSGSRSPKAEPSRKPAAPPAPNASGSSGLAAPPAVSSSSAPADSYARPPSLPYRLVARTTETTWMRVRTEDGRTSEETIPANEVREWISNGPFVITIGNAGGVSLELNGRAVPPLGASGSVIVRLVLPSDNQ